MNLKEKENLAKTFEELCLELGGTFEADGYYTCIVNNEKSLKELEKFFAELIWSNMSPDKDFYAKLNGENKYATIDFTTFGKTPILRYHVTEKERADVPEEIEELGNIDEIVEDLFNCYIGDKEEGEIVCTSSSIIFPWNSIVRKILRGESSETDRLLSKDSEKIDLLKKALDDVREGNIWTYERKVYACDDTVSFAVFRKDGKEIVAGFGMGADGGLLFENTDLPDAIIQYMESEGIAGDFSELKEFEKECA